MTKTDILVIGSGPAGSKVAYGCAEKNKKVTMVDTHFGGTCALKGCTPKKAMEAVTSSFWSAKSKQQAGYPIIDEWVDWHKLRAHVGKFTAMVPAKTKENAKEAGIEVVEGEARFISKNVISIGNQEIEAKKIIIATGARPRPLNMKGEEHLITSAAFFELDDLPQRINIIGGGYIGFELAHILSACGREVTIFSSEEMPLSVFDKELVEEVIHATLEKGIQLKLGYSATKIEKNKKEFIVHSTTKQDENFITKCDAVLHAAGRVPNVKRLGLEQIGLALNDKQGIAVNNFLETETYDHIYALGDVTGHLPFTEIASYEGDIVLHNLFEERRKGVDYSGVPFGTFTYPQLAKVGASPSELEEKGVQFEVKTKDYSHSFIERTSLNEQARYQVIINKNNDKILGGSIVSTRANEQINLISLAIQQNMTTKQFSDLLLLYPTAGHEVKSFF